MIGKVAGSMRMSFQQNWCDFLCQVVYRVHTSCDVEPFFSLLPRPGFEKKWNQVDTLCFENQ